MHTIRSCSSVVDVKAGMEVNDNYNNCTWNLIGIESDQHDDINRGQEIIISRVQLSLSTLHYVVVII